MPTGSPTCRSRTPPAGTSPAPGTSTSTVTSARWPPRVTTAGSPWSTSRSPARTRDWAGSPSAVARPPDQHLLAPRPRTRHREHPMTTVAVIGLGIMGGPIAANLLKAGYEVVGYNRSRDKVDQLVASGGRGASDVADAVRDADVVLTMLPDSPDVEAVVLGDGGVLDSAKSGTLLIDASSI